MEDVRMLVQEEGRAARNLIAFHVDVTSPSTGKSVSRKPPLSPRLPSEARMTKRSPLVATTGSRVRSASTGRDKKSELHARYWAFLFGNLERAVDEIYQTCESDESVSECKEVILVLENFTRDFHNLIEWFKLKWEYENTPPPQRPTSLAWEVRKSSPGKVMTSSRLEKLNHADKESPVRKHMNFASDRKLSSIEDGPKEDSTLQKDLSNKYGLSFGDLEDHLQNGETVVDGLNLNNQNKVKLSDCKSEIVVQINNKENGPDLLECVNDSCKSLTEVSSSSQSSQTEDTALQSSKVPAKSISAASAPVSKKTQPVTKFTVVSHGKNSTVSPISTIKTTPVSSSRKSVPVSPTNTIPPKNLPGRNVAAVTFVPGKKIPTIQAKINTNLNRSNNNLNKISNITQSFETDTTGESKNNEVLEITLTEQDKIDPSREANPSKIEDPSSTPSLSSEKPIINGTVPLDEVRDIAGESQNHMILNNQPLAGNTKENSNIGKNKQNIEKINGVITSTTVLCLKGNVSEQKQKVSEIPGVSSSSNGIDEKVHLRNSSEAVKPIKIDKNIQTDLSHLAQIAAAKQTKVTTLVRNKTAPNIVRKSNEMLASSDSSVEIPKVAKNNTVNQLKTSATALKKQISNPEVNEKTTHEEQNIEHLANEEASNTNMTCPPLRKQTSAPETNIEMKLVSEKQVVEKTSLDQVFINKNGFPPLNVQKGGGDNFKKIQKEKQANENSLNKKVVDRVDRATSPKPAYSAVSKVYRSNTAIELRPRVVHDKTVTSPVKNTSSDKKATDKMLDEKPMKERSSNDKSSIERVPNVKPAVFVASTTNMKPAIRNTATNMKHGISASATNMKPAITSTITKSKPGITTNATNVKPAISNKAPKIYRSSTSIELRPRVSFSRNVASATVKVENRENQASKIRGSNPNIRNSTLLKNSKTLFKSEQNLQEKNVVDEDGWETVKGRNRWKLSQSSGNIKARTPSSRFHQPSPAVSLPALAIASEPSCADPKPAKLHKDRQNQEIAKANRIALRNKSQPTPRQSAKTVNEGVLNSGKKSKKDEEEVKPVTNDRKKLSSGRVLKKVVCEVKEDSDSRKIDKLMDILSSEDEKMNEEEMKKCEELYEAEMKLTQEIQDLEKSEIEVDTETDEAETDGETYAGNEEDYTNCRINALKASYEDVCSQLSWADQMDTLEKLEKLIASDTSTKGIPWAERLSTLEQLEELVARHPGRALELHQKLSSPSRRRHLPDTIQRHRERQESAQLKREQLLQDKTNKMRELLNKVEEVQRQQAQLKEDRKKRIAEKLKRAEENRKSYIRGIQRKAHDEDEKLREIMFINELEAQNKRHDFIASCQEKEGRLRGIHDERQRKQEEKAAKEAAAEERRRLLEAERQERLEKLQEKRRERFERIGREMQEKEKERQTLAREKKRDHKDRLEAIQAIQQANTEELQKKIQQKQVDSARRHEENIEHIRQRALESGAMRGAADDEAPRLTPYDTYKLCTKCNVLIESEVYLLSHLRGKAHQEAVKDMKDGAEPVIVDAPPDKLDAKLAQDRERQKALRKRCKKIRSRMAQRGEEFLSKLSSEGAKKVESPSKMRLLKCLRSVDKLHASQGLGQWPDNAVTLLERNLAEINRILDKQNELDQKVFQELNGFTTLSNILNLALDIPKNMSPYLPPKCFLTTCSAYSLACLNHPANSRFVIFSNKIALVLDLLLNRLNTLITDDYRTSSKSSTNLPVDPVAGILMKLFALILYHSQENIPADLPDMAPRLQDIISYTVSVGVVDKLALYCSSVRDPIDNNVPAAHFLLNAIQLLTTLAQTRCVLVKADPTQLVATLRVTELVGAVSMLYGMLLHQGAPPSSPPTLPLHTVCVTQATLQLLKAVAQLDLTMFQSVLGAEGISLQLRHIASYLLWYCAHPHPSVSSDQWLEDKRELLHQVIEVVGYFAVNHYDNQMMLQSGHMPTVLQQLCNLPFAYFSNPSLSHHLLPTLLACCHGNQENRTILEQELNYQLLEDFRNSELAKSNPLVQLIK